jgi:hypothetical protein
MCTHNKTLIYVHQAKKKIYLCTQIIDLCINGIYLCLADAM